MFTSTSPSVVLFDRPRKSSCVCQFPDGRKVTLTAEQWAEVERGARVSERGGIYWPTASQLREETQRSRRMAELKRKYVRPKPTMKQAAERYPKCSRQYAELVTHFYNRYCGSVEPVAVGLACRHYEPWADENGELCVFHPASLTLAANPVVRVCHHRQLQLHGARLRIDKNIETGLWAVVYLPDTKLGRAVAASMNAGKLSAFSVGVNFGHSSMVNGVREIHAATVKEISFCDQGRIGSCTASLFGADNFAGQRGSVRAVQLREWLETEIAKADAERRRTR